MTSTADSELEAALEQAMASRLRKAGLVGRYASARSELGDRVLALVRSGAGAYLWGLPGRGRTFFSPYLSAAGSRLDNRGCCSPAASVRLGFWGCCTLRGCPGEKNDGPRIAHLRFLHRLHGLLATEPATTPIS